MHRVTNGDYNEEFAVSNIGLAAERINSNRTQQPEVVARRSSYRDNRGQSLELSVKLSPIY
jgi:hypothetical protein